MLNIKIYPKYTNFLFLNLINHSGMQKAININHTRD